jgi:SAM-dependent methyltransferase
VTSASKAAPETPKRQRQYRGNIAFNSRYFSGWTTGPFDETITMRVTDGTGARILWQGECGLPRDARKHGNKFCAFRFTLSGDQVSATDQLRMFDARTGVELPFSPFALPETKDRWIKRLRELAHFPFVHSGSVAQRGGRILARVVYAGDTGPDEPLPFAIENSDGIAELEQAKITRTNPDERLDPRSLGVFWFARSHPTLSLQVDLTEAFDAALVDETGVKYVNLIARKDGTFRPLVDKIAIGLVDQDDVKLPPVTDVRRVQAHGAVGQKFTTLAFQNYRTYRDVFETHAKRSWFDVDAVLDWGCGCARVTQQLMKSLGKDRVWGVDIDAANIQWCLDNLESPNFRICETRPQLPFEDNSFDYIVATSVLTHIPHELVGPWLAELGRVLKPGEIAALTVASDSRVAFGSYDYSRLQALQARGIEDHLRNDQLDNSIDDKDYYRNVRMTKDFIRNEWGKHLDVLEIVDHAIGAQDIVVCRARG